MTVMTNSDINALIERAFLALEDGDFRRADEFCEQALNQDARNARAYLGKLMAELKVRKPEELAQQQKPFDENPNYQKVLRFGDEELKAQITNWSREAGARYERAQSMKKPFPVKKAALIAVLAVCICAAAGLWLAKPYLVKAPLRKAAVGNVVTFGHYEQDNNAANGKEPIEWIVLDTDGSRRLLISRYGLDAKPYNEVHTDVTWETCTLRKWLNGDFLNEAFTQDEQKMIGTTAVDNGKTQGNPKWDTDGGNDTQDRIFLLSFAEAGKYFPGNRDRAVQPTAYAIDRGASILSEEFAKQLKYPGWCAGNSFWWLRSPGYTQFIAAAVSSVGSLGFGDVYNDSVVRPAFWINLYSSNPES